MSARQPAVKRPPPPRRVRHRAEYVALRVVIAVCSAVPAVVADRAGALLGWVVARVGRPRWGVVMRQLRIGFPDAGEGWLRRVGRRCYAHLGAEVVAMFRLAGAGGREIRARTRVSGLEVLQAAAAEGRGVVLVSGHLGNWEVGAAGLVARGFPMDIVAARQRNRLFDRYLTRSRERLGMKVISRGEARRGVLAALKAGRAVGIMGDQDARRAGVFVDFFGMPASTARGPAVLAMRAGAVMATFYTVRLPGWRPRYQIYLEALGGGGGAEGGGGAGGGGRVAEVAALTQAFTRRLEERVREFPEQYFWLHRRWKTPPPGEKAARA